ncbi:MAG: hypothetical protein E7594_01300 [Ruminococcaceae bacterium]|nr:hypothetical protein [Oscillospiraceae bacterium]
MKVFDRPFFKKVAGGGAEPRITPFLVLFAAILPKRTETVFSHKQQRELPKQGSSLIYYVEVFLSVLFLGYVAARKRTKKNGVMRGVAPNPSRFLKKATQKLSSCGGDPLGGATQKPS